MLNCLFYSMFFLLFLNFTYGTTRYSQINRTFLATYKGDFEASIITVDKSGEPTFPYYNQSLLKNYISEHLEKEIKKYSTDYDINLTFYKGDDNIPCSENEESRKVKVSLKAQINYLFTYENEKSFSITSRGKL